MTTQPVTLYIEYLNVHFMVIRFIIKQHDYSVKCFCSLYIDVPAFKVDLSANMKM